MSKLVYSMFCSLDGYSADVEGNFDWAAPDPKLHQAANNLEKGIGTSLYGRCMYETMVFWETGAERVELPPVEAEYAKLWKASEKVVFSTTLKEVSSAKTRLVPVFSTELVRQLKRESPRDLSIGGPRLAAHALRAGLVDEIHLFVFPVVVGGGTKVLPDGVALGLDLLKEQTYPKGVVHLHYRVRP